MVHPCTICKYWKISQNKVKIVLNNTGGTWLNVESGQVRLDKHYNYTYILLYIHNNILIIGCTQRRYWPLPLLPTKRKSLNLATWFFISAVQFRSSAQKFSSFPARMVTAVPSGTSPKATTLNATGSVLLDRQWVGSMVHTRNGLPVRTSSPGCSDRKSPNDRSARMSAVILANASDSPSSSAELCNVPPFIWAPLTTIPWRLCAGAGAPTVVSHRKYVTDRFLK